MLERWQSVEDSWKSGKLNQNVECTYCHECWIVSSFLTLLNQTMHRNVLTITIDCWSTWGGKWQCCHSHAPHLLNSIRSNLFCDIDILICFITFGKVLKRVSQYFQLYPLLFFVRTVVDFAVFLYTWRNGRFCHMVWGHLMSLWCIDIILNAIGTCGVL